MLRQYWAAWKGGWRYVPARTVVSNRRLLTRQALWLRPWIDIPYWYTGAPVYEEVPRSIALSDREALSPLIEVPPYGKSRLVEYTRVVQPTDPDNAETTIKTDPVVSNNNGFATRLAWFPVRFEEPFLLTCYVLSEESQFSGASVSVPGLDPAVAYKSSFLRDIVKQGSGRSLDGRIIHYDGGGRFSYQSCPLTASGACAVDGVTVAVDKKRIPFRGRISIYTQEIEKEYLGSNAALEATRLRVQDVGDAIKVARIDRYFGTRRAECERHGRRVQYVTFDGYQ